MRGYSDEKLLNDLQNVAHHLGEPPTARQYEQYGNYSERTLRSRFQSWNTALERAGFEPNVEWDIPPTDLLKDIVKTANGRIAPSPLEYKATGKYTPTPVLNKFGSWWKAVVRAGLQPLKRRPLTPAEYSQYFQAVNALSPTISLPVLLIMFTGLSSETVVEMDHEWLRSKRDRNIIRVPAEHTDGDKPWLLRLPETWQNPHTGKRVQTELPQTVEWVLNNYRDRKIPLSEGVNVNRRCLRVAQLVEMDNRQSREVKEVGEAPVVRPADLSYTHGVNLARQRVELDSIQQRLGTDGFRRRFFVKDVLLWLYVHENETHPDYEPPDIVLDSVST